MAKFFIDRPIFAWVIALFVLVGGVVSIDFADTARPVVEKLDVDLHAYGYALCILDSGAGHEGLTDEYRAITDELRAVCRVFGRDVLREVPEAEVAQEQALELEQVVLVLVEVLAKVAETVKADAISL